MQFKYNFIFRQVDIQQEEAEEIKINRITLLRELHYTENQDKRSGISYKISSKKDYVNILLYCFQKKEI